MKIGRHLILGFDGTWPDEDFLKLIRTESIGGVILFARNLESREQITELIAKLNDASSEPLLVGVDHEGGRVFRMPEPFTSLPPARVFGQYYERTQDTAEIEELAAMVARELLAVGVNLNFAPVLDVDSCPENPIIGDRAFHSDPEIVASIGLAVIRGFESVGLLCCGKHFPGHGDTREDSHRTQPVVSITQSQLAARELIPFQHAIRVGVPALMTAHVLYPEQDREHCATLSSFFNRQLLRDELGFRGVLFSDDLLMAGIRDGRSVATAAEEAIVAGCDALLVCREFEEQQAVVAGLRQRAETEEAFRAMLKTAGQRLDRLWSRLTRGAVSDLELPQSALASRLAALV